MDTFSWLWLAALVLFAITEAVTEGLVSLWFIGGALTALIASLLGAELWLQIALFLAVSLGLLLCLRPFVRKFLKVKITPTNADRLLGRSAPVTETIENLSGSGAVKIEGNEWSARSKDGSVIPAGTVVKIQKIEGVKLIVTPEKE